MNGIDKILDKLQAESRAETDAILDRAKAEAEAIRERYAAQADQEREAAGEKGRTAAAERQDRLVRAAEMESRKMVLGAKQSVLDKAFAMARDALVSLPRDRYVQLLASLAASSSATGAEAVVMNPKDRAEVGQAVVDAANARRAEKRLPAALTLAEETEDIEGGLLLRDRASEVNCTFDTLLHLGRENLAGQAAGLLFRE